jgi:hypothetical protein
MVMVNLYLFFLMILIKVLIFCSNFSGMALDLKARTGKKSMLNTCKKSLAQMAAAAMRQ